MPIQAVTFDLGGVFFPWPAPEYFTDWEHRLGSARGPLHALLWHGPDIEAANLGVLSAEEYTSRCAARLGADERITDLFDVFVSSAEEGVRKPDPRIFEVLLRRLDLTSSAVAFVDDAGENVEAARRLGFHAIQHVSTSQTIRELAQLVPGSPARA